jgi:taurine dioxygenase
LRHTRLKIEPCSAIGADVSGVALADELPQEIIETIKEALFVNRVLVFRHQRLTSEQQIRFANALGIAAPPEPSKGLSTHQETHPEVQWLTYSPSVETQPCDRRPTQADAWHTDYSYLPHPPEISFLYGVKIPAGGPDTIYIDMQRAYETLPPARRRALDGLRAIHTQKGGLDPALYRLPPYLTAGEKPDEELSPDRSATHGLVRAHPATGLKFLYLAQCYAVGFEGVTSREGRALISDIYGHAARPEFSYRHVWRRGDCIISDNLATNHRRSRPLSSLSVARILSRVMIYLNDSTETATCLSAIRRD